jgi:hypothetical protein
VEPGETSPDITVPVLVPAPLHQQWVNVLADTVSVVGCRCTFCDLRPMQETTERLSRQRKTGIVSTPVYTKPSVLEVLYGLPSSEPQRGEVMLSSSSSSTLVAPEVPRHPGIVNIPGFERSVPISIHLPPGLPNAPPHSLSGIHGPSTLAAYELGLTATGLLH